MRGCSRRALSSVVALAMVLSLFPPRAMAEAVDELGAAEAEATAVDETTELPADNDGALTAEEAAQDDLVQRENASPAEDASQETSESSKTESLDDGALDELDDGSDLADSALVAFGEDDEGEEDPYIVDWTTSGTCEWSIDPEGTLVVRPLDGVEGTLKSWSNNTYTSAPWYQSRNEIITVRFEGLVHIPSCSGLFNGLSKMESADLSHLDVSHGGSMRSMFQGCSSLSSLDYSGWDTSLIRNMRNMFLGCSSLTTLDVSSLDTSQVYDMYSLFQGCSALSSLDLSSWNTSSVTNMNQMFQGCSSLTAIDLSSWDTSSVKDMGDMFLNCTSLTTLDLSGWNTTSVTNLNYIFLGCSSLSSLDASGWDTSSVTDMRAMFYGCSSLSFLDLSGWDTSSVKDMGAMFLNCASLTTLDLSGWDTSSITYMEEMFNGCSSFHSLDLSGWNTSSVTDMSRLFNGCSSLTSLDLSDWDTSSVKNMSWMFWGCSSLSEVKVGESVTTALLTELPSDHDWWSKSDSCWYTRDEISSQRAGMADTYYSYEYHEPLAITAQPADAECALGGTATFSVTATGEGLTYRWQWSRNGGASWNDSTMAGHDAAEMPVAATRARDGYLYRCVVTDYSGESLESDVARLTLVALEITSQPSDAECAPGETATFSVVAEGEGLTYRWQWSKNGGKSWINSTTEGCDAPGMPVVATKARNGYLYRCVVTDPYGNVETSNSATLVVVQLAITSQPMDAECVIGEAAIFSVGATGLGLTYRWQWSRNGGRTWSDSTTAGHDTDTLSVTATAGRDGYRYRCVVTDAGGNNLASAAATLTARAAIVITSQPSDVECALGEVATFSVTATGDGLTYRWQWSRNGGVSWIDSTMAGHDSASMPVTATTARDGYRYRCVVADSCGNVVASDAATLTVAG